MKAKIFIVFMLGVSTTGIALADQCPAPESVLTAVKADAQKLDNYQILKQSNTIPKNTPLQLWYVSAQHTEGVEYNILSCNYGFKGQKNYLAVLEPTTSSTDNVTPQYSDVWQKIGTQISCPKGGPQHILPNTCSWN